jgi:hypothetical protein
MRATETPNPLDGPFVTSAQLTGYSDEPGYAIRLPEAPRTCQACGEPLVLGICTGCITGDD